MTRAEKETNDFLTAFKQLETAVTASTHVDVDSVLDYENYIADTDSNTADKLKTCRIIRNYLTHHTDGTELFPATKKMTEFLNSLSISLENLETTVGKVCRKTIALSPDTTIREAAAGFAAVKGIGIYLPYMEDSITITGCIPDKIVSIALAKTGTPASLLKQTIYSVLSSDAAKNLQTIKPVSAASSEPASKYVGINKTKPIIVFNEKTKKYKGIIQTGEILV